MTYNTKIKFYRFIWILIAIAIIIGVYRVVESKAVNSILLSQSRTPIVPVVSTFSISGQTSGAALGLDIGSLYVGGLSGTSDVIFEKYDEDNGNKIYTISSGLGVGGEVYVNGSNIYVLAGSSPGRIEKRLTSNGDFVCNAYNNWFQSLKGLFGDTNNLFSLSQRYGQPYLALLKFDLSCNRIYDVLGSSYFNCSVCNLRGKSSYIYISGINTSSNKWKIESRLKSNGSLVFDKTYNISGEANSIIDDSSYLYIVGYINSGAPYTKIFNLVKSDLSGNIIYNINYFPGDATYSSNCIAYDIDEKDDYIYIVGSCGFDIDPSHTHVQYIIEKRNKSDGSLVYRVASYPADGSEISSYRSLRRVKVTDSGLYVIGYDSPYWQTSTWVIEKRNPANGNL